MAATVDNQGLIRGCGRRPDGVACRRVLWRRSRDGLTLTLHDPRGGTGDVAIATGQLDGLRHTCPACRTVWRPAEIAGAAA